MEQLPSQSINHTDYTHQLRSRMQAIGLPSFKALSRAAGVSERQISQLRRGKAAQMRGETLLKLSQLLGLSLNELLAEFSSLTTSSVGIEDARTETTVNVDALQQEYQRLQTQLAQQREALQQEFQQSILQQLESLLIQLPTALYAAQQNPDIPATRLAPLLRPIDHLLKDWGIEAIAAVGAEIPYDPHTQVLMDGAADVGDRVRVRYVGYRQGDRLLYRVKVSPLEK